MELPTPWIGKERGYLIDWLTQVWVQITGKKSDTKLEAWLSGPTGSTRARGEEYYREYSIENQLTIKKGLTGTGILEDFDALRCAEFNPEKVDPKVRDFYLRTSDFSFDVWSEWSVGFRPFGWLVAAFFGRRLEQLNVPLSSLETSRGISSQILGFYDTAGKRVTTGWYRTYLESGRVLYAGMYSVCVSPKLQRRSIKVTFPLPNGSAIVVMHPSVVENGALLLESSGSGFGDSGFYFWVARKQQVWIRYLASLKESIRVYVDSQGVLRADHILRLFGITFLRLHYRMTPK